MGERLYNGITLPNEWPPQGMDLACSQPQRVPYLEKRPDVVDIDLGRQLFVDDFLIDGSRPSMARVYHHPTKYSGNPVLFPQTEDEANPDLPPCAIAKFGGVWYDIYDKCFKMWYMASYLGYACLATSQDGIHWERPQLDVVPGTNLCLPRTFHPDSGSVIIDPLASDPAERYKLLLREPGGHDRAYVMTSADGIHWDERGRTGHMGDRSTIFYNPFRKKWVQSVRSGGITPGRDRHYREHDDFLASSNWQEIADLTPWLRADCLDIGIDSYPQLYNVDAIAYESIMLGFHQILKGPPNEIGEAAGMPKLTELTLGYSRDGFHFHRPDRQSFIGARREPGSWEYGYVESSAGMCLVMGDELWFTYSAYAGDPKRTSFKTWQTNGTYANGSVGIAKLRRDGFASMRARFPGSSLVTRPVRFSGSRLFVNANTASSELRASVLDEQGEALEGFDAASCVPFMGNSTCTEIHWQGGALTSLRGRAVQFRFEMDRGDLYAFWVTDSARGASGGYLGAGSPAHGSYRDID